MCSLGSSWWGQGSLPCCLCLLANPDGACALPLHPNPQGAAYRTPAGPGGAGGAGGVALVLGAGNQLPVVALDILHKLAVEGEAVLCKMNPVNE